MNTVATQISLIFLITVQKTFNFFFLFLDVSNLSKFKNLKNSKNKKHTMSHYGKIEYWEERYTRFFCYILFLYI